jgi:polar amino acid transport system substrate-binding protein
MCILRAVLLCALLHSPAWAQHQIDVTILCDAGYPPYSYAENGEAKGLYSDILREAFMRMPGYRVSIRPVPWPRGLAELARGSSFALFPPYHRPDERPWMDYSLPILEERVVTFVRSESVQQRALRDFPSAYAGLRIGLNRGFSVIVDPQYDLMLANGLLEQRFVKDNRTSLLQLKQGRIDVYINDRLSILWELQRMKSEGLTGNGLDWLVEGTTLSSEHGHLGYTRINTQAYPYKDDFKRRLDAALTELQSDGSIERLTRRYSSFELQAVSDSSLSTPRQ